MNFFGFFTKACLKANTSDYASNKITIGDNENFRVKFVYELDESVKDLNDFSCYDRVGAKLATLCGKCGVAVNENFFDRAFPPKMKRASVKTSKKAKSSVVKSHTSFQRKRSADISIICEENEDSDKKTAENLYETVCLIPENIPKLKERKSSKKVRLVNSAASAQSNQVGECAKLEGDEDNNQTLLSETIKKTKKLKKKRLSQKKTKRVKSAGGETAKPVIEAPFDFSQHNLTVVSAADHIKKMDSLKSCLRPSCPTRDENIKLVKKTARINTDNNKTTIVNSKEIKPDEKMSKVTDKVKQIIDAFENKLIKVAHSYKSIASNAIHNKNKIQVKTPINQRKRKSSLTKSNAKRKSATKANAFIKEIVNDVNQSVKVKPQVNQAIVVKKTVTTANRTVVNLNGTVVHHSVKSATVESKLNKSCLGVEVQASLRLQQKPLLQPPPPSVVRKAIPSRQLNDSTLPNQTKIVERTFNRPVLTVKDSKAPDQQKKALKIDLDDLKYGQEKTREVTLNKIRQRVLAESSAAARQNTLKKYGSTSTLSTIVSSSAEDDCSMLSPSNQTYNVNSYDQSFKTVNTTFDSLLACDSHKETSHLLSASHGNASRLHNTSVKPPSEESNSTFTVKTFPIKPIKPIVTDDINHHKMRLQKAQMLREELSKARTANKTHAERVKCLNNRVQPSPRKIPMRTRENYGVEDLRSGDDTDDEDQPRKPIPEWARDVTLRRCAIKQAVTCVNFTDLFKSSLHEDVCLESVFKIKKINFNHRSSSADWSSPPVWRVINPVLSTDVVTAIV